MSTNSKILIGLGFLVLAGIIIYLYNKSKKEAAALASANSGGTKRVCFDLPTSSVPADFGPAYWNAFQTIAADIPCEGCRTYAEKFISFFHDVVNRKVGKAVYDQANYDYVFQTIMTGKI